MTKNIKTSKNIKAKKYIGKSLKILWYFFCTRSTPNQYMVADNRELEGALPGFQTASVGPCLPLTRAPLNHRNTRAAVSDKNPGVQEYGLITTIINTAETTFDSSAILLFDAWRYAERLVSHKSLCCGENIS